MPGLFDDIPAAAPAEPAKPSGLFDDIQVVTPRNSPPAPPPGERIEVRPAGEPIAVTGLHPVDKALQPITDYPSTYNQMRRESQAQIAQGVEDLGTPGKRLSGAWDTIMGAVGFADSPVRAALRTVVGKPIEETTGIPKEYPEFAAGLAIPYYGLKGSAPQQTVRKILSPELMGPEAMDAAAAIRATQGTAARTTAQSLEDIEKWHPIVNKMDDVGRLDLVHYMEGGTPSQALSPQMRQLAATLRQGFESRKAELQNLDRLQTMNFVDNYFPHMWENPRQAQNFLSQWATKEGSGRSTRARSIPTIADGLAAGLKLRTSNPLEAYALYVTNMDRFIATEKVFDEAVKNGTVKYFAPGRAPSDMVPVASRLGQKAGMTAYAPENWARVYNNFTSQGMLSRESRLTGTADVYQTAQQISNALTQSTLALSGYHAVTMTQEAMLNEAARAVQQVSRGSPIAALKSLSLMPIAAARLPMIGHQAEKVYTGVSQGTQEAQDLVHILTEAGARMKGSKHALDYNMSTRGSLATAWRRGSLRQEMLSEAQRMKLGVTPAAGATLRIVGRTLDTVMQPLFEKYIPKLKNGAMMENLADWMKANPGATREETVAAARQIVDSVDNRFGEMVHDNLFWNNTLKQGSRLSMFSYSWTMGAIREIGGGVKDVLDGKGMTQRAAYAITLPMVYALWGAAYQKFKTGENPQDLQDLIAPRTGGENERGMPERVTPPSFMKDVFGWTRHPRQEAYNKLSPGAKLLMSIASGRDWRDDPIAPPGDTEATLPENVPLWLKHYFLHTIDTAMPITIKNVGKGERVGTNLSTFEQFLGMQPAGMEKTDPEGFKQMMQNKERREWMRKERHDEAEKNKYVGTDD